MEEEGKGNGGPTYKGREEKGGEGGKRENEGSSGYCVFPRGARIVTAASEYDERISHCQ